MILRDSTCSLDATCHSTAWVCQRGNPICNEPVSFREESVESISGHSWGVYLSPQRFQPGTGRQLPRVPNHTAPLAYKTTNPHLSGFCPSQASIRVIDYFMRQRSGSNNSCFCIAKLTMFHLFVRSTLKVRRRKSSRQLVSICICECGIPNMF